MPVCNHCPPHLDFVSTREGSVRGLAEHRVVVSGRARDGLRQGEELLSHPAQAGEARVAGGAGRTSCIVTSSAL